MRDVLDFLNDDLKVDAMMISPAYAYEKAPDQEHFMGVEQTRQLFTEAFAEKRRKNWRLNHSPLFLDFLEGKVEFGCTAWGIPSYSVLGWQRPCYLMADGYASSYKELVETTDWSKYGRGKDPRCANCMAHCGYEPTAVIASPGLAAPVAPRAGEHPLSRGAHARPTTGPAALARGCGWTGSSAGALRGHRPAASSTRSGRAEIRRFLSPRSPATAATSAPTSAWSS